MPEVEVTIEPGGNTTIWVRNVCEDLLHDFMYFVAEAEAHNIQEPETIFLHQRFLRAALLALFAYAEAVANGWLLKELEKRGEKKTFKQLELQPLDRKIARLHKFAGVTVPKPALKNAKRLRNSFAHFKPRLDGYSDTRILEGLSLTTVKDAESELTAWMTAVGIALGSSAHVDSEKLANAFTGLGTTIREASSTHTVRKSSINAKT